MKIALAQTQPIKGDVLKNIKSHKVLIKKAIYNNVNLIIFPELSITGYEPELAKILAVKFNDSLLNDFQKISDENNISIIIGMPTKKNDTIQISSIIFQPNTPRSVYSKQNLFPTEIDVFNKGSENISLNFEEYKIALVICYDLSDSEHSLNAYNAGNNIYLASVLNSFSGIEDDISKLSAIAKKYNMIVGMSNFVGESGGYNCAGRSSFWDTNGELINQLNNYDEEILIYDCNSKLV